MAHDLIIRGGSVLDGTGADAVRADVAVDGDRITAIGDLADATATREIDADRPDRSRPGSSTCTRTWTPRSAGTRS